MRNSLSIDRLFVLALILTNFVIQGVALPSIALPISMLSIILMAFWIFCKDVALQRALHDNLTKLPTRQLLERELLRIQNQAKLPLAVIFVDVNNLKQVNDYEGHIIGDQVLVAVAQVFRQSCRKGDLIFRWGGDEFVVLLPDTTKNQANKVGQRILDNCLQHKVSDESIQIALGVGVKYDRKTSFEDVLQGAEKAMYVHKRQLKIHRMRSRDAQHKTNIKGY